MSFLSNSEVREYYAKGIRLVSDINDPQLHPSATGPLEACAINLRIGKIFQTSDVQSSNALEHDELELHQGQMAFVVTKEKINLPNDIGGLMFPKSGGLAERGILITNVGHIDPGYSGELRYVVINMGSSNFRLRKNDYLVKALFFKLYKEANPSWSELHDPIPLPDASKLRALGKDFAAVNRRLDQRAKQAAKDEYARLGLSTLFLTVAASAILAAAAAAVTVLFGLFPIWEEKMDLRLELKLQQHSHP